MNIIWNDLRNTLEFTKAYYNYWWFLGGAHKDREFRLKSTEENFLFFSYDEDAFWDSFILRLASIFDEDSKSISFNSLPILKAHPLFEENWRRGRSLFKYRSKVVAHRDSEVASKGDNFGFKICRNDLKQILNDSCEIFNESARVHGHCELDDFTSAADVKVVLEKVERNSKEDL